MRSENKELNASADIVRTHTLAELPNAGLAKSDRARHIILKEGLMAAAAGARLPAGKFLQNAASPWHSRR
ncbi:hypothetical protein ACRAVF_22905 [Bradyrhizobium oligotrophicum S58]